MGKAEFMCFSIDIMVCVMKIESISTPLTTKGQGHLVTFANGHCPITFSKDFFSETTWPVSTKLHMQPPGRAGNNVDTFSSGHMTKMAALPIYGKNLKKIFFSRTTGSIALKLGM